MIYIKKDVFPRCCSHKLLIPIYFQAVPKKFKKHFYIHPVDWMG